MHILLVICLLCSAIQSLLYSAQVSSAKRRADDSSCDIGEPSAKRQAGILACSLLATPYDPIIDMIADDINAVAEKGYVGIETPSLSNKIIIGELLEAANKGARVRVFVNNPRNENNSESLVNTYSHLRNNKVIVTELSNLHAKRIIIFKNTPTAQDQRVLYLGSLNMTENSPYNHEIMMRCTDRTLFTENFGDQHRLGQPFYNQPGKPIDFHSRSVTHSSYPEAAAAKKKIIEEFSGCTHPHDYLYVAAYTLDDPDIVQAIIHAQKNSDKPIKVILDGINWQKHKISVLKPLVLAHVDVYVFNKDGSKKTPGGYLKMTHIKAILRQCNQQCVSLISTANFTLAGRRDINYDLWESCSLGFSAQLKKILDTIIQESEKVDPSEFQSLQTDGTPQGMGRKMLELMKYPAQMFDNTAEIMRLIAAGADLTLTDARYHDTTALMYATHYDHVEVLNALIDAGAQVNQHINHRTALQGAVSGGKYHLVKILIDAGAELNHADKHGNTPLFSAVGAGYNEIAQLLISAGADVNIGGDYRVTGFRNEFKGVIPPIVEAARRGNLKMVEALIAAHAHIDAKDREGYTAFLRAFESKNIPVIRTLARTGADLNIQYPRSGYTALIQAVLKNDMELIKVLLEAGADLEARDRYRKTAFDYAVGKPHIQDFLEDIKFITENPDFIEDIKFETENIERLKSK